MVYVINVDHKYKVILYERLSVIVRYVVNFGVKYIFFLPYI